MRLPQKLHLQIIFYRARVLLLSEDSRTWLGYFWWVLEPALELAIFYTVFGLLLQRGGADFAAQLLTGVIVFRLFSQTTNVAPDLLIQNEHVIMAVPLPKYIFPAAHVVLNAFKFIFLLLVLGIFLFFLNIPFSPAYFFVLPLSLLYIGFCLGVSMILAGFTPFLPDFSRVYQKISMLLFWASGVFFRPEDYLPETWLPGFYANPVAGFITAYRDCLLFGRIDVQALLPLVAATLVALLLGYGLLARFDKRYPRILAQQ